MKKDYESGLIIHIHSAQWLILAKVSVNVVPWRQLAEMGALVNLRKSGEGMGI